MVQRAIALPMVKNEYARIEERAILPTTDQGLCCIRVCQMLSNYYRNIELFRFNERTGEVIFL
jgi:hypothetical protein